MTASTPHQQPPAPSGALLPRVLSTVTADPGRPRLTWYGPDGERIELSGHVLDNWVTKATNLLVEEFHAGPASEVVLDLPPHWRTVVWAFAAWRAGACVATDDPGTVEAGTVVVTDRPERWAGTPADVVAVALPALARRFDGALPPGVTDSSAAVLGYGDVLTYVREHSPAACAVRTLGPGATTRAHAELGAWARETADARWPGEEWLDAADESVAYRALLQARDDDALAVVAAAVVVFGADGSVVLTSPDVTTALAEDAARREHLVETERVGRLV
ncbi:TIGR03089 family protein [Cellulomonas carbonis]|uniref:TIGR03089 family protein n=1 Tax=Cellulomonas carbonis T26 TaxID=947969 RepID=A0A0A0BND4_9CELL|nr:TIGR03089 family protein [Cellulomonas carbonis]KGM09167.1 hypothetical protein N868_03955 [Cellulomonas carbonis T26]GGC11442.1 hypothetical protein GCM10010972_25940 [Cellulomonas carbonis]